MEELFSRAQAAYARGDLQAAYELFVDVRERALAEGDDELAARTAYHLGNVLRSLSRYADAEAMFAHAMAYAVRTGDDIGKAHCHLGLGNVYRGQSRYDDARQAYRAAERVYQAEPTCWQERMDVRINRGLVDYLAGNFTEAKRRLTSVLDDCLAGRFGGAAGVDAAVVEDLIIECRFNLGNVERELGDFGAAKRLLDEAAAHYEQRREIIKFADCRLSQGNVYRQTGHAREAGTAWIEARTIFNANSWLEKGADCTVNLGNLSLDDGHVDEALRRFDDAREQYELRGLREHAADCRHNAGFALLVAGDFGAAEEMMLQARRAYEEHGLDVPPDCSAALAEVMFAQQRYAAARHWLDIARTGYEAAELTFDVARTRMTEAIIMWKDERGQPSEHARARSALELAVPSLLTTDDVRFQFSSSRDRAAWAQLVHHDLAFVLHLAHVVGDADVLGDLVESFTSVGWYAVDDPSPSDRALSARHVKRAMRPSAPRDPEDPVAVFDDVVLPLLPAPRLRVLAADGPRLALADYVRPISEAMAHLDPLVTW